MRNVLRLVKNIFTKLRQPIVRVLVPSGGTRLYAPDVYDSWTAKLLVGRVFL